MKIKQLVKRTSFIVFSVFFTLSTLNNTLADKDGGDWGIGIECVGKYSTWEDLDDLKSPINIADDFKKEFEDEKKWNVKYTLKDNNVDANHFRGKSLGGYDYIYADNVDLLIYSGHGVKPKKHGATDYSFALNTSKPTKYAEMNEMYLGNQDLEWLVTFTCNFLASKDLKRIGHMAKGIHAICGYETRVVLTPDMGSVFAKKLKNGYSVKEAFFATGKETKVWYKISETAGVFTTKSNANDRLWGYGSVEPDPKSYSDDSSGYILYTYKY